MLVEIADWVSADALAAVMTVAETSGAFAPMFELLAAPFRVTTVEPLG